MKKDRVFEILVKTNRRERSLIRSDIKGYNAEKSVIESLDNVFSSYLECSRKSNAQECVQQIPKTHKLSSEKWRKVHKLLYQVVIGRLKEVHKQRISDLQISELLDRAAVSNEYRATSGALDALRKAESLIIKYRKYSFLDRYFLYRLRVRERHFDDTTIGDEIVQTRNAQKVIGQVLAQRRLIESKVELGDAYNAAMVGGFTYDSTESIFLQEIDSFEEFEGRSDDNVVKSYLQHCRECEEYLRLNKYWFDCFRMREFEEAIQILERMNVLFHKLRPELKFGPEIENIVMVYAHQGNFAGCVKTFDRIPGFSISATYWIVRCLNWKSIATLVTGTMDGVSEMYQEMLAQKDFVERSNEGRYIHHYYANLARLAVLEDKWECFDTHFEAWQAGPKALQNKQLERVMEIIQVFGYLKTGVYSLCKSRAKSIKRRGNKKLQGEEQEFVDTICDYLIMHAEDKSGGKEEQCGAGALTKLLLKMEKKHGYAVYKEWFPFRCWLQGIAAKATTS